MLDFVQTVFAFLVCLGVLVAVHEWGHFFVARLCGVHVERFSVGFGKPLWAKKDKQGTEYVIAAIPLGGYVKMLDERVDYVPDEKRHLAFNNKHVLKRIAIIFAGPFVNFVFAVFLLFITNLIGQQTVRPFLGPIEQESIAGRAGLKEGQQIVAIGERDTADWEAITFELVSYIGSDFIPVRVKNENGDQKLLNLVTKNWSLNPDEESPIRSLGIEPYSPSPTTEIRLISKDSAASKAGLKVGDTVIAMNGESIDTWQQFVGIIHDSPAKNVQIDVLRAGKIHQVSATIGRLETSDGEIGLLGVSPNFEPMPEGYIYERHFGIIDGVLNALDRTWRLMALSVKMLVKFVTGDLSVKNLNGPISIAQGAGVSAGFGLVYFLGFTALISVNLGIVNLLPLPMLDGGHLMYFVIEWIRGKPVSEAVQEWGFRIGGVLLFSIMSIALFNDLTRLV